MNNVNDIGNETVESLKAELEQSRKENDALEREVYGLKQTLSLVEQNYTFQKNVYDEVKRQKERGDFYLKLVFDYTPDIIMILDNDLKLIYATKNSLKRYGVSIGNVKGANLRDFLMSFLPLEYIERGKGIIKEVREKGVEIKTDHLVIDGREASYTFEESIVPLRNDADDIIGVMITMHDVTDLHSALESSDRASRAKSSFLAKISHEIRTPMNAILGLSELVLRADINKDAREHVVGIKQAGTHLVSIINDILDFSKIESGKMEIVSGEYSLSSFLNYVTSITRTKLIDLPILFTANVDPTLPENLIGDEMRVKQMVLNLLSNACKYCEKGYIKLNVGYEAVDKELVMLDIEVADSGIGIKEENIGRLFGDFVQLGEAVGKRKVEGTGLGLAITRGFAVAMGGNISVESEYGKGSVFRITIPQKLDSSKKEPFARVEDGNRKLSVLVYETREAYSHSLAQTLNSLGIKHKLVTSQSDFHDEMHRKNKAGGNYSFVFVSSFLYDSTKKAIKEVDWGDTILVLIVEYGELVIENDSTKTLIMPAHAGDVANIINHGVGGHENKVQKRGANFVAPTARVLVVDDITTNLIVTQGLLSSYKVLVDLCKSGKEAIELVQGVNDYDMVFLDHMMPEMDGIEALARIRALVPAEDRNADYYKNLPFVALTANAVSGMKEMFIKNGFNDFLAKPIDVNILDSILENWLPKDKLEDIAETDVTSVESPAFKIDGIDVENGIYMTGGDARNYLKTLSIFREDGMEKISVIRMCVETDDLPLYAIHVHALKSASASIGAAKVSNFARSLETAAKNADRDFVLKNNERFIEELSTLLDSIKHAVASTRAVKKRDSVEIDSEAVKEQADELRAALEILDMEEVDSVLTALRGQADGDADIERVIDDISNNILICEYDKANELIDRLVGMVSG